MSKLSAFLCSFLLVVGCSMPQASGAQQSYHPASAGHPQSGLPVESLTIQTDTGPVKFDVEIADNDTTRETGMMWRRSVGRTQGMLFEFQEVRPVSFWMRNTLISLDLVFVRSDGIIARVIANAVPRSEILLDSGEPVAAVLEIGGGEAARQGIKAGQRIDHAFFGTAPDNN